MKTDPPTVHCIFAENAPALPALIQSTFRLYLKHIQEKTVSDTVPAAPVHQDAP